MSNVWFKRSHEEHELEKQVSSSSVVVANNGLQTYVCNLQYGITLYVPSLKIVCHVVCELDGDEGRRVLV